MLPWFARNLGLIGQPLSSAGAQTLWLCNYDEIFSFGVRLDFTHWIGCGLDPALLAKLRAVGSGLVHLVAENGLIFAAPLMVLGLWQVRSNRLFRPALLYLALLFPAMTLAFTFVGDRGGLFHSSAALMPFLCAAAPIGLDRVVVSAVRRFKTWRIERATRGFSVLLIGLAISLSAVVTVERIVVQDWNRADIAYRQAGDWLAARGDRDSVVMAGNPPGFTYHTGHSSVVTPNADVDTLLEVAQRFDAKWLVLDPNRPIPLAALYSNPQLDPRLTLVATFGNTYLFAVNTHEAERRLQNAHRRVRNATYPGLTSVQFSPSAVLPLPLWRHTHA